MRRFLTLVCLLFVALPAGITITGCYRNPAANYCNNLGFGTKITDLYTITLAPQNTGISMAFGQTRQVAVRRQRDFVQEARRCQRDRVYVRHHEQSAGGHIAFGQHVRRDVESELGGRHCGLHDLQLSEPGAEDGRPAVLYGVHFGLGAIGDFESGGSVCARAGDVDNAGGSRAVSVPDGADAVGCAGLLCVERETGADVRSLDGDVVELCLPSARRGDVSAELHQLDRCAELQRSHGGSRVHQRRDQPDHGADAGNDGDYRVGGRVRIVGRLLLQCVRPPRFQ